jgi:cytochrome b6-f complex iron-sulfur subunit
MGSGAQPQSRRRFLRDAGVAAAAFVLAGCASHRARRHAAPSIPTSTFPGSFGGQIDAGPLDKILDRIASSHEPYYVPAARAYVSAFPAVNRVAAKRRYPEAVFPALDAGVVVLYQRCTHLGCRTPFCSSSQYFECPCHAARFDLVGEKRAGPAPRGLDLMPASIRQGRLVIDTGTILPGLPAGTNTTHQAPAGPFCVG